MEKSHLANKIIQLRESKAISQKELAEIIGVSIPMVSRYENGKAKPSRNKVIKISDYFQVPIEYFNEPSIREIKEGKVSIVKAGGKASKNTLRYRIIIPNRWIHFMGITSENRMVDLIYKNQQIIIQNHLTNKLNYDGEIRTTTVKISNAGGGASPGTKKHMIQIPTIWSQYMNITEDSRTIQLEFDGTKIIVYMINNNFNRE